jgi:hypothetical protein
MATEQWNDLYFRHNMEDVGKYPTGGSLSASPDIVPLGSHSVSDPQYMIADDQWSRDLGNSTNASEPNYIYLRGANLSDNDTTGTVSLYYSPGSLLLWPTDPVDPKKGWAKRPLTTSGGDKSIRVTAKAKARFATSEAFRWVPEPIWNDHYCLVARVATKEHENPIPEVGTLTDFGAYISTHPNMAWRNVVTINPAHPVSTTTVNYSQGVQGGLVYLNMRCENVPDGSKISMSCGTPGPDPMIEVKPTTVSNTIGSDGMARFSLTLYSKIPDDWTSDISYTWYSEGKTPLPGMKIFLDPIMPAAYDDRILGAFARPLTAFGIAEESISDASPRTGIRLGSQLMKTPPVAANAASAPTLVVAGTSSLLFSGVGWADRYASIFGGRTANYDIAVHREQVQEVQTETVTLNTAGPATEGGDTPDVVVDTKLESGAYSGRALAVLTVKNIPLGAEVWFKNTDGSVTIAVQPRVVDNSTSFTVTADVDDLPAGYPSTIRSVLRLNGHARPTKPELKFSIQEVPSPAEAAGPKPSKLLGAVTLKP